MKKDFPMVNVPSNSLTVLDAERNSFDAKIRMFKSGKIALTGFAISQFLEGFELLVKDDNNKNVTKESILLALKLTKSISAFIHTGVAEIDVTYQELVDLRSWLETRMKHCEKERDARTVWSHNPDQLKFNPDTYIGQKLLLMDIRELMLGEVVPF